MILSDLRTVVSRVELKTVTRAPRPAPAAPARGIHKGVLLQASYIFYVATLYKTITSGRKCQENIKGEDCESRIDLTEW